MKDKSKVIFFIQADGFEELKEIIHQGILNFVVDNETDFNNILSVAKSLNVKINLSIRMKFQENRIGTGKYFVYGLPSKRVNELIIREKENKFIDKFGIHIHRKSQNTSEWEIISELNDSIFSEVFDRLDFINLGGGLPVKYKSYSSDILNYIFKKLKETIEWLKERKVEIFIEPGRYIAAPSIKLETEIIQIQDKNIILNTTIYNCALDTILTGTKMIIEGELNDNEEGDYYLIKGNSPTRDDIFRYNVKLKNPKVGDKIVFLNAGAYNYTTDFFGYTKLETVIN
jgi:ornithine decarboxylase